MDPRVAQIIRQYNNVDEFEPGRWQFNSVKDAKAAHKKLEGVFPNIFWRKIDVIGKRDDAAIPGGG